MSKQQVQVNRDVLVQVLEVLVRASSYYDTYAEIEALRAALEQPEQEPYCYVYEYDSAFGLHREFYPGPYNGKQKPDRTVPVYTHTPRREWRGLTDEERRECTASPFVVDNYRAIEAALKEKNK